MLRIRERLWRRGSGPKAVDQSQDIAEKPPRDRDLCELKGDEAALAPDLAPDLDELLPLLRL